MPESSRLVMVTCYDASFARLIALTKAVDFVLVGDSMGTVIYGDSTTTKVTMEMMQRHIAAVRKGFEKSGVKDLPQIVGDFPVDSYRTEEEALRNARLLREAGADIVKLEGPMIGVVKALDSAGIEVCGHVGLTPQSIHEYRLQGKDPENASRIFKESVELEKAGCSMIVLEMLPSALAGEITESLSIPTIGIGAGPKTKGQVLVLYDLLGFDLSFSPKFLKRFANGETFVCDGIRAFAREVRQERYPDSSHSF